MHPLDSSASHRWGASLTAVFPALCVILAGLVTLWPFTAEDAYIVAKYAENLAQHGHLQFNLGEPVNALTSPLHALLESALALIGPPVALYKWIGALCLAATVALVAWSFRGRPWSQAGALLIVAAPCVVMWTVGGLETPLLMLWATALTVLALAPEAVTPRRAYAVAGFAALAVLTRYDAVLFAGPLALGTLLRLYAQPRQRRHVVGAVLVGAIPVLAWLGIAWSYYGNPIPTSFYVKPPGRTNTLLNAWYVAQYLTFVGAVPLALLAFLGKRRQRPMWKGVPLELALALGAMWLYSLSAATTHMMFGFRLGVPYVPALALVVGLGLSAVSPAARPPESRRIAWGWGLAFGALALFHIAHLHHVQTVGVNGFAVGLKPYDVNVKPRPGSPRIEYQRFSAETYQTDFMPGLQEAAGAIEKDWISRSGGAPTRPPSVATYAAGILPYSYPEAYVFEVLVSYRQQCQYMRTEKEAADYIHLYDLEEREESKLVPLWTTGRYTEVFRQDFLFDGRPSRVYVFHNASPKPNPLPARIVDPCPPEAEWAHPITQW